MSRRADGRTHARTLSLLLLFECLSQSQPHGGPAWEGLLVDFSGSDGLIWVQPGVLTPQGGAIHIALSSGADPLGRLSAAGCEHAIRAYDRLTGNILVCRES